MSKPVIDHLLGLCQKPDGPIVLETEELAAADADRLIASLTQLNIQARAIDVGRFPNKAALLKEVARVFAFPSYFGHNWDAVLDCWSDFSWLSARGYVCILLNADSLRAADPETHHTLLSTAQDAGQRWHHHDQKTIFKIIRVGKV